jgi:hypothetical protein
VSEERRYSVEQANASLTDLRPRLRRIREARQVVIRAGERIREQVAADGGGHQGTDYLEAVRVLKSEVEHLATLDILLRDPGTGLVDFPSEREGATVYLCWRPDEPTVAHWHPPDTGFAGRRPL